MVTKKAKEAAYIIVACIILTIIALVIGFLTGEIHFE